MIMNYFLVIIGLVGVHADYLRLLPYVENENFLLDELVNDISSDLITTEPSASPTPFQFDPPVIPVPQPTSVPQPTEEPFVPTEFPTPQPTYIPLSPIIMFKTNITLGSLNVNILDLLAQTTLMDALANTMGFPSSACTFTSSKILSRRRRLDDQDVLWDPNNYLMQEEVEGQIKEELNEIPFATSSKVQTISSVVVALDQTTYRTADLLYDESTQAMLEAVSKGTFTASLRSLAKSMNSVIMLPAKVTNVSFSPPTIIPGLIPVNNAKSRDNKQPLTTGTMIIIVVCGSAGLWMAWLCCFCLCWYMPSSESDDGSSFHSEPSQYIDNPALQQGGGAAGGGNSRRAGGGMGGGSTHSSASSQSSSSASTSAYSINRPTRPVTMV